MTKGEPEMTEPTVTLADIQRLIFRAHICSNHCFNAHQMTQKVYFKEAHDNFDRTWASLPQWLREILVDPECRVGLNL